MTKGEALKKMQAVKAYMTSGNPMWDVTEIGEAFDMAIEALEQPEIIRCKDCAKREYCRTTTVWAVASDDDWYCADAERRTE